MFLNRIAQGFRAQNWYTVFVELLVLIVGIFLGLQVDDWNQRRLDRIEEQYYLARLQRDFERSLIEQNSAIETAREKFEAAVSILRMLESDSPPNMTDAQFDELLGRTRGFPRLALVTATMDEIVANGKASILQSRVLREELAAFVEWYEDRERYYDYLSRGIIDSYWRQTRYVRPEWPELESFPKLSTNREALVDDAGAISAMRQMASAFSQLWRDLRALNRETNEIYDVLKNEAGLSNRD